MRRCATNPSSTQRKPLPPTFLGSVIRGTSRNAPSDARRSLNRFTKPPAPQPPPSMFGAFTQQTNKITQTHAHVNTVLMAMVVVGWLVWLSSCRNRSRLVPPLGMCISGTLAKRGRTLLCLCLLLQHAGRPQRTLRSTSGECASRCVIIHPL